MKLKNKHILPTLVIWSLLLGFIATGLAAEPIGKLKTPNSFEVNGANVITSDIEASNGVIHIIDSVLLSPDDKLTQKEATKDVIELAIRRGVPLFNAGQPSACAAIYEVAVESLLKSHSNALDSDDRSILERTLLRIRSGEEDPNQQAWRLRRTLHAVYESLGRN